MIEENGPLDDKINGLDQKFKERVPLRCSFTATTL